MVATDARGRPAAATASPCPDDGLLASLTPETRLLLAAAPVDPEPERLGRSLDADVDWDRMLALLLRERAVLPFWRSVRPLAGRIDPGPRDRLERLAAATELRMGMLRRRLLDSLGALEEAGVEAVVLKGGALANTLYPDWRDRPMSDLDLLVPAGRAGDARRALTARGWRRDDERYPEEMYRRHYHLPPLRDARGSGAELEIHTGLLLPGHPFDLDTEGIRERATAVEVEGRRMRVPAAADHLLYVCLHFAWGHALQAGIWRTARDVRVLSGASEDFSWRAFSARADEAGAGPCAYWTLRLSRTLGSTPVPEAVGRRLRPPLPVFAIRALERHLAAQLFATEPGCPSVRLAQGLWLLATRPAGGRKSDVRPWSFSEDFRDPRSGDGDAATPSLPERLRGHLSRPGAWWAYLSRMLLRGWARP